MKKQFAGLLALMFSGAVMAESITSPSGDIVLEFSLSESGRPFYSVSYKGEEIVRPSSLGLELSGRPSLLDGFVRTGFSRGSSDETWAPVWGENDSIRDAYNSMTVSLMRPRRDGAEGPDRLKLIFRAYDDGVAFRYELPSQTHNEFKIKEERTQIAVSGDHTAWWIPGDYDTQEYEYTKSRLSEIRALREGGVNYNLSQTSFSPTGVQTSLMLKTDKGLYINLHEAALVDYPAMHLNLDDTVMVFESWLTPGLEAAKASVTAPFKTPWRTVTVSDKATDILASHLILNLNEPCALEDVSWIKPVKYMGVWWEMITGKSQWSYTDDDCSDLAAVDYSTVKPHGKHGANNDNVRRYIDFAAANGFDQLLIEGWNIGWEEWFGHEKDYVFDFLTPYPDFDIKALNDYAHSKGIRLMMHHETSGSVANYERHLDRAYELMNRYGYNAVKSGYVGNILPKGETHYSQRMVRHFLDAVKRAADRHIMVNGHEAVRPTGLCRTYPNLIANEAAMGTEYQSMTPGHVTILPFTRLQGGPMDFTPGIFRMDIGSFAPGNPNYKRATVANQLALYLTMYSPLQMAADLPEHYEEKADAFRFIREVPVDWSESRYLDAEPGEYIVVARRGKGSGDWYVGGVTGADARKYTLKLDFLPAGKKYAATVYADAPDADCYDNPEAYVITEKTVTSKSKLDFGMARGGGFALSLKEL